MQRRWQVWAQPDGRLVWVPASDAPPAPPPPPAASLPPLPPRPLAEGSGGGDGGGGRLQSMADLLSEARKQLMEADGMAGAAVDARKGGMFCTGSGRSVAVSDRAIRRAKAVVGEEEEEIIDIQRKQPFTDAADLVDELRQTDEPSNGNVHKDIRTPLFQTGSGKAVILSKDSIQKARSVLEGGIENENASGAIQPMFYTGMGRSVPISRSNIDKARVVLEGQKVAKQDVAVVDSMEQFTLIKNSPGKAVLVSVASVQTAKDALEEKSTSGGKKYMEDLGTPDQFLMFQTVLKRPNLINERSTERSRDVVKDNDVENSGHVDSSVCAKTLQTETPRSVLMSTSFIMNDGTVTPEGGVGMQEKTHEDVHMPLFQTELGGLVLVSKSSIKRASAALEPRNIAEEFEDEANLDGGHATPMLQTGSGRTILATEISRKKAKTVLEAQETVQRVNNGIQEGFAEGPTFHVGIQEFVPQNIISNHKAINFAEKEGSEVPGRQLPMFQTGSGKSVMISESSVKKARAVLEEESSINKNNQKVLSNMDKKFAIFTSPLKTSCSRTVNISSVGVSRAATLLGLEEDTLSTQFFGHVGDKLGTKITVNRENPEHRLDVAPVRGISGGCPRTSFLTENQIRVDQQQLFGCSKNAISSSLEHPIMFSTAGGKSMPISSEALQRAKSLLGEFDLVVSPNDLASHSLTPACKETLAPACEDKLSTRTVSPNEDEPDLSKISRANVETEPATLSHHTTHHRKNTGSFGFAVYDTPMVNRNAYKFQLGREYHPSIGIPKIPKPFSRCSDTDNGGDTKGNTRRPHILAGVLVDTTNHMGTNSGHVDHSANEKRIVGGRNSTPPFKRPRSSRFIAPMNTNKLSSAGVSKVQRAQISPCRTKLSACYPFQYQRKTYKEYFGGPPYFKHLEDVSDEMKFMDAKRAEKYRFQSTDTGAEEFQKMLLSCGASLSYATKEWVSNHYKWIVWKLASIERCYPTKVAGKFFTVDNIFEELKYRYDREVNCGHRSAIKKILDGSALPSLMMVLCISAIYSCPDQDNSNLEADRADTSEGSNVSKSLSDCKRNLPAKIELTDGWYSLEASLDVELSKQLEKRKLFIGQKLRIWGASLSGWAGPLSFHEASGTVKLMVHINGTYRARWDDTLGFCKHVGLPLAFKCIKASGGRVPKTLVGVVRKYPIMYKERLPDGRCVVRSERMERNALQLYQQRVSKITEDILSEQQENCDNIDDNDEGAKICKMLEHAAEPEVVMAGMTSEQIMSLSSYRTKQKIDWQNEVAKKVEKALEVAGLSSRDVTPFLKVRVTGLTCKNSATKTKSSSKEGMITIWNPTEKQKADLGEGHIYSITGLVASTYSTEILYLHARGSSTMWKLLTSAQTTDFEPFFTPRKAIELSKMSEVPLASEFDIAGVVLHVGDAYLCSNQKRQWLFLTDGSKFMLEQKSNEQDDCLLAVSFSSPTTGDNSVFFSHALTGNIVGFSNLVKRQKDHMRQIWVAEATESTTYSLSNDISKTSHLKEAAISAEKLALNFYPKIQQLKDRVLCILGDSGG